MLVAAFLQSATVLFVDLSSLPTYVAQSCGLRLLEKPLRAKTWQYLMKLCCRFEIICLRGLGAAILTFFKVWYTLEEGESILSKVSGKSWSNRGFLLLRGMLGSTAISIYFFAIKMMVIGDAVSIFFTNPVFVMYDR